MNQPFNNALNQTATNPGAITYTPMALTEIAMPTMPTAPATPATTTAPASYTHMPDGSWADAQVTLSSSATTPMPDTPTAAPGSEEEQVIAMYQMQIEMDNMMFQQNMMKMQQQAAMAQKAAMAARNQNSNVEVKWVQSPDLKSAIGDDEGGDE